MPVEVIGSGMMAQAFDAIATDKASAIICASGVADSQTADSSAFRREHELLTKLARKASTTHSTLVFLSSAPVYGESPGFRAEADPTSPTTPYGRHKLECERLVSNSGARYLILRLPNVVGSGGHPRQLIPALIAQSMSGSVVVRTDATRDLLDVDDLVGITAGLLRSRAQDLILNVASGVSTPVSMLVDYIGIALRVAPAITLVGGGDRQEFSVSTVRDILPDYPEFDDNYPKVVLLRRAPSILNSLRDRALI